MSGLQPPISMWPAAEGCDPVAAGGTADVVTSFAAGILHLEAKVCCLCPGWCVANRAGRLLARLATSRTRSRRTMTPP